MATWRGMTTRRHDYTVLLEGNGVCACVHEETYDDPHDQMTCVKLGTYSEEGDTVEIQWECQADYMKDGLSTPKERRWWNVIRHRKTIGHRNACFEDIGHRKTIIRLTETIIRKTIIRLNSNTGMTRYTEECGLSDFKECGLLHFLDSINFPNIDQMWILLGVRLGNQLGAKSIHTLVAIGWYSDARLQCQFYSGLG